MIVFKLFMIAVSISLIITGIFVIRTIRLKNLLSNLSKSENAVYHFIFETKIGFMGIIASYGFFILSIFSSNLNNPEMLFTFVLLYFLSACVLYLTTGGVIVFDRNKFVIKKRCYSYSEIKKIKRGRIFDYMIYVYTSDGKKYGIDTLNQENTELFMEMVNINSHFTAEPEI